MQKKTRLMISGICLIAVFTFLALPHIAIAVQKPEYKCYCTQGPITVKCSLQESCLECCAQGGTAYPDR